MSAHPPGPSCITLGTTIRNGSADRAKGALFARSPMHNSPSERHPRYRKGFAKMRGQFAHLATTQEK